MYFVLVNLLLLLYVCGNKKQKTGKYWNQEAVKSANDTYSDCYFYLSGSQSRGTIAVCELTYRPGLNSGSVASEFKVGDLSCAIDAKRHFFLFFVNFFLKKCQFQN